MGHSRADNIYYEGEAVSLAASAARTTNGSGSTVAVGTAHTLRATLSVTAASGTTPSLTARIETSEDGTTWRTALTFTAATGATTQRLSTSGLDRFIRAAWTITGTTPSLTFSVTGELV